MANLIWCVAGTEEEDEYAAQVYLNMYGDDGVGFGDDYDEDDITMEEIENTLKNEVGSESEESEMEDEEVEEEEEEEEEEGEEEIDRDNDDDDSEEEPDEEGGNEEEEEMDDSEIPHCRGAHLASLFVRTFFHTVRREWGRMDKYRVDKFYSLIRMLMHQVFRYMGLRHWSRGIVRIFNDVLHEEILSQTPNGLRYHLIDLTLEELAAVNKKAPMPLTEATFLDCLEPYFAMASVDVGDNSVRARVIENVLSKFLEEYSFVSPNPAKDEEGKPLTMDQVHVGTVAELIFNLASDTDTPDHCRESLYEMHKSYMRAIKMAGKDVDLGPGQSDVGSDEEGMVMCMDCNDDKQVDGIEEESDEEIDVKESKQGGKKQNSKGDDDDDDEDEEAFERDHLYDGDLDTPERIRKRKLAADEESDRTNDPPNVGESSKKRKKRKKKKKESIEVVEQSTQTNQIVEGKGTIADKKNEITSVPAEKVIVENKNVKKKNKKKKSKESGRATSSADEKSETSEEITISMADQKAAKQVMEASKAPKKNDRSGKKNDSKQVKDDAAAERKRVKFGEKNMARSWKASMKGLRTMSPVTPLPTPEKGILYKKDGDVGTKKAKKINARRKAADYF